MFHYDDDFGASAASGQKAPSGFGKAMSLIGLAVSLAIFVGFLFYTATPSRGAEAPAPACTSETLAGIEASLKDIQKSGEVEFTLTKFEKLHAASLMKSIEDMFGPAPFPADTILVIEVKGTGAARVGFFFEGCYQGSIDVPLNIYEALVRKANGEKV